MKRREDSNIEYSLCVLGVRKPTCEEASKFFQSDMKIFHCDYVSNVTELTKEEAYSAFDMEGYEEKLPVFGK